MGGKKTDLKQAHPYRLIQTLATRFLVITISQPMRCALSRKMLTLFGEKIISEVTDNVHQP